MTRGNELRRDGVSQTDALTVIRGEITRTPNHGEIENTLRKIYEEPIAQPSVYRSKVPRPPLPTRQDDSLINEVRKSGFNQVALTLESPHNRPESLSPAEVLQRLFPDDPLICLAPFPYKCFVKRRSEFYRIESLPFMVPQPMLPIAVGARSPVGVRNKNTVGPRRHIVYESDNLDLDTQSAVIKRLSSELPLQVVVFSGNKSLHAWFRTEGRSEDELTPFTRLAILLGACNGSLHRAQLVRTPAAINSKTGKRQTVLYLSR
jgi:hypothetical protein